MPGCLLIHGFTGNPEEVKPLGEELVKNGYLIEIPVLAGHGNREELKRVKWKEWVYTAEDALNRLYRLTPDVMIVGFSMGGMIAAHLATRYPVTRLVLLSAPLFYPNFRQIFMDLWEESRLQGWRVPVKLWDYLWKLLIIPKRPVWQFHQLVKTLSRDLPRVQIPTLIIHGNRDDIVHPKSSQEIYNQIAATEKHLYFLPNSKHMICRDQEAALLKELVLRFVPSPVSRLP
ncbi:Carboxylesterase [[Clostridium] ultunense Esp]|nr:Carboxylesterase [[Clostridium] ultunense Esp]